MMQSSSGAIVPVLGSGGGGVTAPPILHLAAAGGGAHRQPIISMPLHRRMLLERQMQQEHQERLMQQQQQQQDGNSGQSEWTGSYYRYNGMTNLRDADDATTSSTTGAKNGIDGRASRGAAASTSTNSNANVNANGNTTAASAANAPTLHPLATNGTAKAVHGDGGGGVGTMVRNSSKTVGQVEAHQGPSSSGSSNGNSEGYQFDGGLGSMDAGKSPYWVGLGGRGRGSASAAAAGAATTAEEGVFLPVGRRGHSSTMYYVSGGTARDAGTSQGDSSEEEEEEEEKQQQERQQEQEYYIVSGGFSDTDWSTFPLYAFDISTETWTDLSAQLPTPSSSTLQNCKQSTVRPDSPNPNAIDDDTGNPINLWNYSMDCPPPPRMSHYTVVRNDHLYVFGGLLYDDHGGLFYQEDRDFVYRIDLHYLVVAAKEGLPGDMVKGWERILPRIVVPPSASSSNGVDVGGSTGGSTSSTTSATASTTTTTTVSGPNRGEMKGGYWRKEDKVIIHGGLRVHDTPRDALGMGRQVDTNLGDVWSYDLTTDTWERMMPGGGGGGGGGGRYGTTSSGSSSQNEYPAARTAHGAAVAGNALVIYGGMAKVEENMWDGRTVWSDLSDVWIFDLVGKKWEQRGLFPTLKRAYHTIVAWDEEGDGNAAAAAAADPGRVSLAAFGGYTTAIDPLSEEAVTYVFDDVLLSQPPDLQSGKLDFPIEVMNFWLKAETSSFDYTDIDPTESISARMEHSASLSNTTGMMYVWGGRFRTTSDVDDGVVWALNVAGPDSRVQWEMAQPDELVRDADGQAAHVLLAAMMFVGMILTTMAHSGAFTRSMDDYDEDGEGTTDNGARPPPRRGTGLRQSVIDAHMPVTTFPAAKSAAAAGGTDDEPVEDNLEIQQGSEDSAADDPTSSIHEVVECQICLIDFEDGDEIRSLPCGHQFHPSCVDPWFRGHTSCPACRHDLSSLTAPTDRHEGQLPIFLRRFFDSNPDGRDPTFDEVFSSYSSTLELQEEEPQDEASSRDTSQPDLEERSSTRRSRRPRSSPPRRSPSPDASIGSSRRQRRRRRGGRALEGRRVPLNHYRQANADIV